MRNNFKKYQRILFLLQIFFLSNVFAQQGWYNVTSPANYALWGMYFRDANNGIVGAFKTSNGGQSWVNLTYGGPMMYPNPNTGYIAGSNILKTTNFGDNWIIQQNPTNYNLYAVYFPTVNIGYSCGQGATIIKTTNGGNNWLILNSPLSPLTYGFGSLYFTDTISGYIVGQGNDTSAILKTTNGGLNWNVNYFWDIGLKLSSIFFVNSNTGIAGGSRYLYKTINGGQYWNLKYSPTANIISSLYFPSVDTGFGACENGDIIKTTDGGETWFKQYSGTGYSLITVFFVNNFTGYICGVAGTVLKTTNGGGPPIGIKPISQDVPKDFKLFQNYPNPFNPSTRINFSLPKRTFVKIIIYDVQGKVIDEIANIELDAGSYSVDWNGSNFSSGVYFYRIISGDFSETKRMVLLK